MIFGEYAGKAVVCVVLRTYELREQLVRRNKIMTVTRAIAVTAILAGLAVSAAGSAWADPQNPNTNQMSGHYIRTDTSSTGQTADGDWYFTPCGDGCASLAFTRGGPAKAQAQLVSGQWTMDVADTPAACSDGSKVPGAYDAHYSWDANTLAGTGQVTYKQAACGVPQGGTYTHTIQLRQAP
jgi:hypothetical protein